LLRGKYPCSGRIEADSEQKRSRAISQAALVGLSKTWPHLFGK
jgi:hypothetical protein